MSSTNLAPSWLEESLTTTFCELGTYFHIPSRPSPFACIRTCPESRPALPDRSILYDDRAVRWAAPLGRVEEGLPVWTQLDQLVSLVAVASGRPLDSWNVLVLRPG